MQVCCPTTSLAREIREMCSLSAASVGPTSYRRHVRIVLIRPLPMTGPAEFLHLISSESNEVCEKDSKKTIAPEHVIQALKDLGFEKYVDGVEDIIKDHKTAAKDREEKMSKKVKDTGMSAEELQRHQEMLFAASKARYEATN